MSIACPRTRHWLQQTLISWQLRTICRSVSTTSAINRGLRATKAAHGRTRPLTESDGLSSHTPAISRRPRDGTAPSPRYAANTRAGSASSSRAAAPWSAKSVQTPREGKGKQPDRPSAERSRGQRIPTDSPPRRLRTAATARAGRESLEFKAQLSIPIKKAPTPVEVPIARKELSIPLSTIKSSLADLQHAEQLSTGQQSHLPATPLAHVRQVLRDLNKDYQADVWTGKDVHRGLKASLDRVQWSWRRDGGPTPRLWFNRSDKKLELILKDGSSDPNVGVDVSQKSAIAEPFPSVKISYHGGELGVENLPHDEFDDVQPSESGSARRAVEHELEEPLSIPYTTAASVFLYGSNTVYAALKAHRRKSYKLHLHARLTGREKHGQSIPRMAKAAKIPIVMHKNTRLLDKMSEDRPHNGVVLEASTIPAPPTLSLNKPTHSTGATRLVLEKQSAEDEAINGKAGLLSAPMKDQRHPLVVMLDGITDPGNVGSILRTCYFYGVDAVAIATNTCANLNSATLAKASSGACEAIPILAIPKPAAFVSQSAKAGWRIFAAVAPPTPTIKPDGTLARWSKKYAATSALAAKSPLSEAPCILMLGAEGEGLRENLMDKAESYVCIESGRGKNHELDVDVDSLNVSVATSVLLEAFMRPALAGGKQAEERDMGF